MNGPYKIGTLARLTGFSPMLLRAWEKRFGLITPERGSGRQREYGEDDLAVLQRVRALVDQGRAIGEIARHGRTRLLSGEEPMPSPIESAAATSAAREFRARIIRGALALDAREVTSALDDAFATLGSELAVADVIVPSGVRIGELWEAGRCAIASEHLASSCFLRRLGRLLDAAQPVSPRAPRVVAACFPDEDHQIGLLVLAWHLAKHGVRVEYLGAATPLEDLIRTCRIVRPRALVLSVMTREIFDRYRRELTRVSRDTQANFYVGGQGVSAAPGTASGRIAFMPGWSPTDAAQHIVSALNREEVPPRRRAARSR